MIACIHISIVFVKVLSVQATYMWGVLNPMSEDFDLIVTETIPLSLSDYSIYFLKFVTSF